MVENAFEIMAARFHIFHTSINAQPKKVDKYILAAYMLHNYLHQNYRCTYTPPGALDSYDVDCGNVVPGDWRLQDHQYFYDIQASQQRNATLMAKRNCSIMLIMLTMREKCHGRITLFRFVK